jgi:hypothetical protein
MGIVSDNKTAIVNVKPPDHIITQRRARTKRKIGP